MHQFLTDWVFFRLFWGKKRKMHQNVYLRPRKKKTLFYGHDRPIFSIFVDFFFLYSLLNLSKTSHFWSNTKQIWLNFFGNNWKSFSKFFLQKMSDFWEILKFFKGVIFATRREKKNVPTDTTWKVHPPVKQGFFFFFFFFFFCGLRVLFMKKKII